MNLITPNEKGAFEITRKRLFFAVVIKINNTFCAPE